MEQGQRAVSEIGNKRRKDTHYCKYSKSEFIKCENIYGSLWCVCVCAQRIISISIPIFIVVLLVCLNVFFFFLFCPHMISHNMLLSKTSANIRNLVVILFHRFLHSIHSNRFASGSVFSDENFVKNNHRKDDSIRFQYTYKSHKCTKRYAIHSYANKTKKKNT